MVVIIILPPQPPLTEVRPTITTYIHVYMPICIHTCL